MKEIKMPEVAYDVGQKMHGFEVKRVEKLESLCIVFYELEHIGTGAKYIHLANNDKENVFCVAFRTVPEDSTGVAHILEHTVLTGSRKYDVKDAFFSMLNRSMQTFMNAFTADDWTAYPFATQNEKDYYNLMSVYLDAAFYPKIAKLSFMQEGCRLEYDDDGKLTYKGVVFNEMKGSMSSPDRVMCEAINSSIFPTSTYGNNSGGDPNVIPDLTHEQLVAFHARFYHPSNSFFYTYGNMNLEKHLKFIEENVLSKFERINPGSEVKKEERWREKREVVKKYPVGVGSDDEGKYQSSMSWLQAPISDSFEILTLDLLEDILMGNLASPLRKALIDSDLGDDMSDESGYNSEFKDTMFSCGLKGVKKENLSQVKDVVIKVLEGVVNEGIDKELIEAAIHKMEFSHKEVTNSPYPYGLALFLLISGSYIHDADTVNALEFSKDLKRLKDELSAGPFLENQVKKYFLENQHRLDLVLEPDTGMQERNEKLLLDRLEEVDKKLSVDEKFEIKKLSKDLRNLQDSEGDVSALPTVSVDDVPKKVERVEVVDFEADIPTMLYNEPINEIFYFNSVFELENLSEEKLSMLPLFSYLLGKMKTKNRSHDEVAHYIDRYTGGVHFSCGTYAKMNEQGRDFLTFGFEAKCLNQNRSKMFEIVNELVAETDFSDLKMLNKFIFEYKSRFESQIVDSGHVFSVSLASRGFSRSAYLAELWHGIHQLEIVKKVVLELDDDKLKKLSLLFSELKDDVFRRKVVKVSVIADNEGLLDLRFMINSFAEILSEGEMVLKNENENNIVLQKEAWCTSSSVSFVACTIKVASIESVDASVLFVISKLLTSNFLLTELREKRGAYGGYARYDYFEGLFTFSSYRDPHLVSTLNIYSKAMEFVKSGGFKEEMVDEAILRSCSDIDKPGSPSDRAKRDFLRRIVGLSEDMRQSFKDGVLSVDKKKIVEVAQKYFPEKWEECSVSVISGDEKVLAANDKLGDAKLKVKKI